MKYLGLELYKLKRRKVFLTFALILGVELLFVFSNYGNNENFLGMISDPNAPAWEDLIVGPATMNGPFPPYSGSGYCQPHLRYGTPGKYMEAVGVQ